ncbi:hypothetical protein LTR53_011754 [Teratosphaeriaceae sp. CCFEE 6253]|nr:hypothetical protein LTR53_011754 [Teratosphaeriaceae sp. CCFEE 6253]
MARPRWQYLVIFLYFLSVAVAASPTSFCKCTCFANSTLIPLDDSAGARSSDEGATPVTTQKRTCNDCTKAFCLDFHLPICQDATEADVFTTCFQRDSRKDETIVFIFICATGGLLIWAVVGPWVERWREQAGARQAYVPVSSEQGGG